MADQDLLNALNDCIDQLAKGQSVEDCLRRYPDYAVDLRPMLEMGILVRRTRVSPLEITPAKDRVRFRLEQHRRRRPRANLRPVVWSAAIALIILLVGIGVITENSLPGDALYGLKRITEGVRLLAAGASPELQKNFVQRRRDETAGLLALKRAAEVNFEGELESIKGSDWRVWGLDVGVASAVPGSQSVQVGDWIGVRASTTMHGTLVARQISLIKKGEPVPPTPSPTDTATAIATITPTSTESPTPMVTSTETPTLLPTMTASAMFTTTAPPTATLARTAAPTHTRTITAQSRTRPTITPPPPTLPGKVEDHGGNGNSGSGSGSSGSNSGDNGDNKGGSDHSDHQDSGDDKGSSTGKDSSR